MSAALHARVRAARAAGRRLLAPYLCAGWPGPDATLPLLHALADGGADLVELGVPFSDPLADGGTIQAAAQEALASGATLAGALAVARAFTAARDVPLVLMTYVNPLLRAGGAAAVAAARAAGCAALIVPDLPPEEAWRLADGAVAPALPLVPLVAPNTPDARLREVAALDPPFLYCVAVLGVTGARERVAGDTLAFLARVRAATGVPALVGFGVSGPEQAARLGGAADGVIVGSALIDRLRALPPGADAPAAARAFVRSLRDALDAPPSRADAPRAAPGGAPAC